MAYTHGLDCHGLDTSVGMLQQASAKIPEAILSRPQSRGQRDSDFHAQSLTLFNHFPKP